MPVALKAYPDGCAYLCWEFGDVLYNLSYRPARGTITDRGVAMILLPNMGPTSGLADVQKKTDKKGLRWWTQAP